MKKGVTASKNLRAWQGERGKLDMQMCKTQPVNLACDHMVKPFSTRQRLRQFKCYCQEFTI